ncbi:hypothetical protein U8D42_10965 [Mycobacterium europaeum]|uniref:Uncharacterized protein n=1 Tax=Mycobacterium europaeum TaxID=761804 RepID=A0A0U1DG70_9MYCO|nr:hypothetical protein [Mycobacterium europaeum]MEA1162081.1 hypothetical protein [Mycobacterium europaeum]ORV65189.1 hypothetical protein AWC03_02170 [Mycobacterium europaeum]CQD14892.1 hypothetical protein BN000_03070 [Mycobacterium europaeum]
MTDPHTAYVAHHMLLLAIPAFLPAVIVVAVILYVALRDRRAGGDDGSPDGSEAARGAADEKRD